MIPLEHNSGVVLLYGFYHFIFAIYHLISLNKDNIIQKEGIRKLSSPGGLFYGKMVKKGILRNLTDCSSPVVLNPEA